ncbi:hypothetical protein FB451DRAFT_1180248 [Mycena latifolia]|nr:hypothetical protein FB451DRAFT_1180248 [Mycena latifolia]
MPVVRPPLDCSLNLSEIIDHHIAHENRGAFFAFADAAGHITEVSQLEFCRAAHRAAHLLRPQRRGPEGQVLAIVALTDVVLYQALVAGCIKAGIVPFPISHRNSASAVLHLLKSTGSHRLLTTKGSLSHLVDAVAAESSAQSPPYELSIEEIPLLGEIYPHLGRERKEDPFEHYPGPAIRTPLDDVAMYLHSSGSTGFPKCIPETHRTILNFANMGQFPRSPPRRFEVLTPPTRGICGRTGEIPAPGRRRVTTFHAMGLFTQMLPPLTNCSTACIHPPASTATAYVVPPVPTPESALENARKAHATGITAVPAMILEWQSPEHVAYLKTLNLLVLISNVQGNWWGPLASQVGDALVKQGVKLMSMYGATEFGAVSVPKMRQAEIDAGEWAWLRFSSRGDGTLECQFLCGPFGRRADMANGEKDGCLGRWRTVMMASPSSRARLCSGASVTRSGYSSSQIPSLSSIPRTRQTACEIPEFNLDAPAFGRIYKEMILVTEPDKPMIRAPKGTVIKKATIGLYKEESRHFMRRSKPAATRPVTSSLPPRGPPASLNSGSRSTPGLLAERDIRGGRRLFDQGFDSLNATFLRHRIVGAFEKFWDEAAKAAAQKIPQNFAYAHPSIEQLASAIIKLLASDKSTGSDLDPGRRKLKGSASVPDRQKDAFLDHALDVELLSSKKLVYLEGDTSKADLGLTANVYTTLRDTITVIIHNAWTLDFNKSLTTFEPHVKELATSLIWRADRQNASILRFLFTSCCYGSGYGESKYISERILAASGLQATSFRIGQVTGAATNGAWSTTDWVPAIVKSSIALGSFPSNASVVMAWIPPEAVARTIVMQHYVRNARRLQLTWFIHGLYPGTLSCRAWPASRNALSYHSLTGSVSSRHVLRTRRPRILKYSRYQATRFLYLGGGGRGSASTGFSTLKAQALSDAMRLAEQLSTKDAER